MLTDVRASTGIDALDAVLGGLYWGDSVVWQRDRAPVEPFYRAIASQSGTFDSRTVVSFGAAVNVYGVPGLTILDAGPGGPSSQPVGLLRELRRLCRRRARRLLLFDSLDGMVRAWGAHDAREFFTHCCPLLFEAGAVAYWTVGVQGAPAVQDAVEALAQCVLRVDERNVRVIKAEGRDDGVIGSVLRWHDVGGRPVLSRPEVVDRVAASLRTVRSARGLSQHDVGELAGVSASAISQVERAERGLSLATLARLSAALGITIDDLLHEPHPGAYRIGRREDDPERGLHDTLTLLGGGASDMQVDLVHLEAREAGTAPTIGAGTGIVVVARGLVQVQVGDRTPALRHGEVLVARGEPIEGWRNLGQAAAVLFWILLRDSWAPSDGVRGNGGTTRP